MRTIETRLHRATGSRGTRISVRFVEDTTETVFSGYDHGLSMAKNHATAAAKFAKTNGYDVRLWGTLSGRKQGGYVFCSLDYMDQIDVQDVRI